MLTPSRHEVGGAGFAIRYTFVTQTVSATVKKPASEIIGRERFISFIEAEAIYNSMTCRSGEFLNSFYFCRCKDV